ncbi:hypothetical protein GQ457_18G004650 [Hibiscus cannabinus]
MGFNKKEVKRRKKFPFPLCFKTSATEIRKLRLSIRNPSCPFAVVHRQRPHRPVAVAGKQVAFVGDEDHLLLTRDGLLLGDKCLLLWLGQGRDQGMLLEQGCAVCCAKEWANQDSFSWVTCETKKGQ